SVETSAPITVNGGAGDDILTVGGTGTATLNGGVGNDTLFDDGTGKDTLNGNDGNDVVHLNTGYLSVDGGSGTDTVYLDSLGSTIDLTGSLGHTLKNIEIINTSGSAANTLILDAASVAAMSGGALGTDTILVTKGDANDSVQLDATWQLAGTETVS